MAERKGEAASRLEGRVAILRSYAEPELAALYGELYFPVTERFMPPFGVS